MGNSCSSDKGIMLLMKDGGDKLVKPFKNNNNNSQAQIYAQLDCNDDSTTAQLASAETLSTVREESAPNYAVRRYSDASSKHSKSNTNKSKSTSASNRSLPQAPLTPSSSSSASSSKKRRHSTKGISNANNSDIGGVIISNNGVNNNNNSNVCFAELVVTSAPLKAANYNHLHNTVTMNFKEHVNTHKKSSGYPLGVVGLRNLGNTCFLNSSLQCLSATIPLTDYFLGYNYRSEVNRDNPLGTSGKLVTAYGALIKGMWLGSNRVIKPLTFKLQLEKFAPQFKGTYQHDSQELLSFLLDGIHEDLNRIKKKPYILDKDCDGSNDEQDAIDAWANYLRRDKSIVVDIFQGQLRNRLKCMTCGFKNVRFEPFMYLSLPISDDCSSLQDCLDLYLETEFLSGKNRWYCTKCKKRRTTMKQTDIWVLPPILIVHLKRFKFNENGRIGSKNNASINYPVDGWDLAKYVRSSGGERYDLYAVSNHMGSLGGGHYTAVTLNRFDEQWYEFNDGQTCRVPKRMHKQLGSNAYVLFYNRCNGTKENERTPLVRRQSESRPDLWPHQQVQRHQVRRFSRQPSQKPVPLVQLSEMAYSVSCSTTSENTNEDNLSSKSMESLDPCPTYASSTFQILEEGSEGDDS